ncbi:MAG: hypothetical protein KatS3mg083_119 [Candidatus Dojkabacteria bacterium]|nr:MAG: hypothetical protein KatS3mg083_119 [Candidatus Dojkabacteria bacterium]
MLRYSQMSFREFADRIMDRVAKAPYGYIVGVSTNI